MSSIKRKKLFLKVIIAWAFINVLYFSFFYTKVYSKAEFEIEVSASKPTKVWFLLKQKHLNKNIFTQKNIVDSRKKKIQVEIPENYELAHYAMYWEGRKDEQINIHELNINNGQKTIVFDDAQKYIQYNSIGVESNKIDNTIMLNSTIYGNRWVILDNLDTLNKIRAKKKHNYIPVIFNIILGLLLILVFTYIQVDKFLILFFQSEKNSLIYKIREFVLLAWVFLMPFWIRSSTVFLIISLILTLVFYIQTRPRKILKETILKFWPLWLLCFVHLIPMVYSSNVSDEILVFVKRLPFIFMPFVFMGLTNNSLRKAVKIFKISVPLYLIILSVTIFNSYYLLETEIIFLKFYRQLVENYWHSSYLSSFLLIYLIFLGIGRKVIINYLLLVIPIIGFMYLVQARAPLVIGGIIVLITLIKFKVSNHILRKLVLAFIVTIITATGFVAIHSNSLTKKLNLNIEKNHPYRVIDARLEIWGACSKLIKENFWFGTGNRKVVENISKTLSSKTNIKFREYNAHNQYLELFLAIGVFGFLAFVFQLIYPLRFGNNSLILIFLLMSSFLFIVESYITRHAGIVFYTFWYCFFMHYKKENIE